MKAKLFLLGTAGLLAATLSAQNRPLNIIAFGAHPDDCDIKFGGTAAKLAKAGHKVKFVSVTNGDAGHHEMGGGMLAMRRTKEAHESAKRLGIAEYEVFDNHDGELLPTIEIRRQVIRAIRNWKADVVIAPRPNDYHPDHRYTGVLIQDAAYMVVVPNVTPDTPHLHDNPVFMYYHDGFQKPSPFRPDMVVALDDVWETKVRGLDAHVSQFYEWLPWVDHRLAEIPKDPEGRLKYLRGQRIQPINDDTRAALVRRYGADQAKGVRYVEAFELCEYGRRASLAELDKIFPK